MKKNIISNKDPKTRILCSKLLTKTDLKKQFTLPTEFVREPLIFYDEGVKKYIKCFDSYGCQWDFSIYSRKGKDPKPTIPQGSWQKFVKEHRLHLGDAVVFYTREDDPDNSLQIRRMGERIVPFAREKQWVELGKEAEEPTRIGSP